MTGIQIRRRLSGVDTVLGRDGKATFRKAWAAAVISDPFAGQAGGDLVPFATMGAHLGEELGRAALAGLGRLGADLSYGKGAIVGAASDLERGAALLHPKLGAPLRGLIGRGKAIIPSTIKQGGPGCTLDVPLHGVDDEWDFALLDACEVRAPSAPLGDEILVAVVLARGGRAFARIGRDA